MLVVAALEASSSMEGRRRCLAASLSLSLSAAFAAEGGVEAEAEAEGERQASAAQSPTPPLAWKASLAQARHSNSAATAGSAHA